MKHLFTALAVLLGVCCQAQRDFFSGHSTCAAELGLTQCRPAGLNDLVIPPGSGFENLLTFGLSLTSPSGTRYDQFDAAIALHFFRPSNSITGWSDTTSKTIRGWELMTSLFGFDLLQNMNAMDVVVGPGIYWGRLKVDQKSLTTGAEGSYSNGFIAPMARLDVRAILGSFVIGGRCSYRFDLSGDRWKSNEEGLASIPGYRFRDIQYLAYVGFCIRSTK